MNYHWIGHCREGTSDKVWGMICLDSNNAAMHPWTSFKYVAFWGRRGKKLQTKIHEHLIHYEANKLCDKKQDKGYQTIDPNRLNEVYPEFENDLQATAVWAMLSS